jgi:hypothetical protein
MSGRRASTVVPRAHASRPLRAWRSGSVLVGIGSLFVAGLLTGCSGAGSTAAAPPASAAAAPQQIEVIHGTGTAAPPNEYELQDLHTAAEQLHEPFDEVAAGQRGSNELDALTTDLEVHRTAGFVTAGHDPDRPGRAWIVFVEHPDEATMARIRALPWITEVRWGAPLDAHDLSAFQSSVLAGLERVPGVIPISAAPSTYADRIDVEYAVRDGAAAPSSDRLEAAARAAAAAWSTDGELRLPVRFVRGSVSDIPSFCTASSPCGTENGGHGR